MWYNNTMDDEINRQYKYRKWPLFLPAYILFSIFYFFFVYSFVEFSYKTLAETLLMTIFVITAPLLVYFNLKIVKIKTYISLGLDLLYAWLTSTVFMFILMLTYFEDWNWFGAIALLFFLFCYYIFFLIFSYIYFRIKKQKNNL